MRFVTRAGVIISLVFAVLAMHGSTPSVRALTPAVDTIAMPSLMMQDAHPMQDMNVHGADAICLWTLVGGVLLAMGRSNSARVRRVRCAADLNAIGSKVWPSHPGPAPTGPDPPFLLSTLRR